ncbi:MAG: DUF1461 domain-containing protein [Actinomycetota bacterium]|nr:DUF1461 domain-containing protein [Actinomycetota bacterium]
MTQALEKAAVGLALAVLIAGVSVIALTTPGFTRTVMLATHGPALAGLDRDTAVRTAEEVRRYVADGSVGQTLPAVVGARSGFDASATAHLDDVRAVMEATRLATGLSAALLAVWMLAAFVSRRWRVVTGALRAAAGIAVSGTVLASAIAALDFDRFFAGFHGLFFETGTWTFPADTLLVQLFPEAFWVAAGVAWAGLLLFAAAALAVGAGVVDARLARSSA